MKIKAVLSLIIGLIFININIFGQELDSIVKVEKQQTYVTSFPADNLFQLLSKQQKEITEINNLLNTKSESSTYSGLVYLLAFIGVLITAVVSYRVGTNQNKTNLKIKKIEITSSDKEKLSALKKNILHRPLAKTLTREEFVTSLIDNVIYKIHETLKLSEYFEESFIAELNNTNQEYQRLVQEEKLNNRSAFQIPVTLLEKLKSADKTISINIDDEIRKRQNKIEELI